MADNTVVGLRAAIKSLKDVVAPAVDNANPLAVEQLRMVCGYLAMVCERLPWRGERVRFELDHAIGLARELTEATGTDAGEAGLAMKAALLPANRLRQDPRARELDIESATAELNAAIAAVVRHRRGSGSESGDRSRVDDVSRQTVERTVLAHSKAWLDVQRAWFVPLGFDSESTSLPSIGDALSATPASGSHA